ncbi:hypothetical protein [Streptomyces sp. NBC_00842]|uniref:hypothetical protein n=1 Tax=Streptomyces sp. NBC_00842 TaxID=2975848 RepID=UPI003865283A
MADGKGLIGHAGAVLLRRLADRTGLTAALAGVLPGTGGHGWRERGAVLVQLTVAIALGARSLSEAEALQAHYQGLLRARSGGAVARGAETGAGGGPAGPERARAAPADRLDPVKKL